MKLFDPQRWAARSVAALLFCAALPLAGAPALASGTMRIQHYYGGANVYNGVGIKVIHDALYITSPDGKGTIVINRAACYYHKGLTTCLPNGMTLVQSGGTWPIHLRTGTIYVNRGGSTVMLPLSTTKVPANGLLLSLQTEKGTYISVIGTFDAVTKK